MKTNEILKGEMGSFSKLLKFVQYFSIMTSEYGLSKLHLRGIGAPKILDGLVGGEALSTEMLSDMKLRWNKLGTAVGTARVITRGGDFLDNLRFFVTKMNNLMSGKTTVKQECPL